ncbi:MAP/microtubule affinity-regulating kinase 3-like protein [Cricetulus griseus]|uniref:MAP/microtubule affinity-regulating kinase 3-like protein n=1 Tax=Cricetulus griseus TaxID=10029 RepID=A0A061HWD5_CRIGR|nr:MAP/microtubule affinity-regulating kinase 3-like protein [Cricetulus griseus]
MLRRGSSGTSRVPPASPSSHSLAPPSGERSRLARGSTIRSTFHGGQVRDRRAGGGSGGGVQNGPPASPTLAHEASPLPSGRPRPTTNLFTKLTSKLTRRVTLDPSKRQNSNRCVSGASLPQGSKISKSCSALLCSALLLLSVGVVD